MCIRRYECEGPAAGLAARQPALGAELRIGAHSSSLVRPAVPRTTGGVASEEFQRPRCTHRSRTKRCDAPCGGAALCQEAHSAASLSSLRPAADFLAPSRRVLAGRPRNRRRLVPTGPLAHPAEGRLQRGRFRAPFIPSITSPLGGRFPRRGAAVFFGLLAWLALDPFSRAYGGGYFSASGPPLTAAVSPPHQRSASSRAAFTGGEMESVFRPRSRSAYVSPLSWSRPALHSFAL